MSVLTKLLPVVIALSACSHNDVQPERKPSQQKEVFTTDISNNGEKIFNLHLSSGHQQRPNGNGRPPAGNRGAPPSGDRGGPPPGGANGGPPPNDGNMNSRHGEKIFNLHLSSGHQQRPNGNGRPPAGNRGAPPSGDRGGPPPGGANGGPPPNDGNMNSRQGDHDIDEQQVREQLEQRLKDHLNTTQYCRDGYIIHHTFVGMSSQILTGECVELATQDDRINSPNVASAILKK